MKPRKEMVRMGTKVGAVLGGIAFLAFGIVPGFYFGSYGTLVLLSKLFGGPMEASVLVRVAVAGGVLVGITCIASVTIVVGAIFGTVAGYLTEALSSAARAKAPATEAHAKAE